MSTTAAAAPLPDPTHRTRGATPSACSGTVAPGLTRQTVADAVYDAVRACAVELRPDVLAAVEAAVASEEPGGRAAGVLGSVIENAAVAAEAGVPLCQDTGTVWVCLEVGRELMVPGDVLDGVDEAVGRAYRDGRLRMSVLADALSARVNTGDNTPAFCELRLVPGHGATLHVMLKGGGSDNASRVVMLPPGAGRAGIVDAVVSCVREKAANACPPLVVGVGVGATFDKVAGLAKHALLRPVGEPAPDAGAAALEADLLAAVNALGIGPGALGGRTTALSVAVETAPCHIAALPVAVNMGCVALRSRSTVLVPWDGEDGDACARPGAAAMSPANQGDGGGALCSGDPEHEVDRTLPHPGAARAPRRLTLPLSPDDLADLRIGDEVLLSGPLYTMRDAGHARALEALDATGELPFGLAGHALFYAGPTPAAAGRPLGSVGPTTASRMDFATPRLMEAGVTVTIGKGKRGPEVADACRATGGVYLACVGGIAALLASHVTSSELVAWDDLGTEALRRLEVADLPAFVAIDPTGADLYRAVEAGEA
ncbi:MAG: fumarate hydratase [Eggerthellaceae bacterium]|nr:fumarate hydratase [Eggerthellaceae bacterium]